MIYTEYKASGKVRSRKLLLRRCPKDYGKKAREGSMPRRLYFVRSMTEIRTEKAAII